MCPSKEVQMSMGWLVNFVPFIPVKTSCQWCSITTDDKLHQWYKMLYISVSFTGYLLVPTGYVVDVKWVYFFQSPKPRCFFLLLLFPNLQLSPPTDTGSSAITWGNLSAFTQLIWDQRTQLFSYTLYSLRTINCLSWLPNKLAAKGT